jgi:hypothetical protein
MGRASKDGTDADADMEDNIDTDVDDNIDTDVFFFFLVI